MSSKDKVKPGQVAIQWEKCAIDDAVKFITAGACKDESEYFASGMVQAGNLLGVLSQRTKTWDFLKGTIVDWGCGLGRHTLWFHKVFHKAIGVDVSPEMISLAKENFKDVDFRVSKTETTIPVEADSVNIVFSVIALQHNPRANVKKVLEEMKRILMKDGIACIQLPVVSDPENIVFPANPNSTARWGLDEFNQAIKGLFEPIRIATDQHFGYHILKVIK